MPKSKNAVTKSGAKRDGVARSTVTGRQLGKRDRRALNKNANIAENFMELIGEATTRGELQSLVSESKLILGRVMRNLGCNSLRVLFQQAVDGELEGVVGIAGTILIKGRANNKTDKSNCMCAGDHVVIDGGMASSKLTAAQADSVMRTFARLELRVPGGFFTDGISTAATATAATVAADEEGDFTWDRGEEAAAEAEAEAARKAALKMRAASMKVKVTLDTGDVATAAAAAASTAAAADARMEVAAAAIPTMAPPVAVPVAAVKVKNTGPSRAERRAAQQAAEEAAAELAALQSRLIDDNDGELDLTLI